MENQGDGFHSFPKTLAFENKSTFSFSIYSMQTFDSSFSDTAESVECFFISNKSSGFPTSGLNEVKDIPIYHNI